MTASTPFRYPRFLGSEIPQFAPEAALFHIIPVPYERTTSYGSGTRAGPSAILEASWQLETWDGKSDPSIQGIYTHPPVDTDSEPPTVLKRIATATTAALNRQKIPVVLGGEHTITYGVVQGLLNAGHSDFGVVQIDAHADLRDTYQGDPLSHACVMKRIADLQIPIFQLGTRAYCQEERAVRQQHNIRFIDAEQLATAPFDPYFLPQDFPDKVFFTIDIDGLDPSLFPTTGTPVPGGLGWYQTLHLFETVVRQRCLIGFDLVEFVPSAYFPGYSFAAAQLLYHFMGIVQRSS